MPQEEVTGRRDETYAVWHRKPSLRRYVGLEKSQTLAMILTGDDEMVYSAWHRRYSTKRFVSFRTAESLAMVDIDVIVYAEIDDGDHCVLALIEVARDMGQDYKCATATRDLAQKAGIPAFLVLYKPSASNTNPADRQIPDIESFRIKQLAPKTQKRWDNLSPKQWAERLAGIREDSAARMDNEAGILRTRPTGAASTSTRPFPPADEIKLPDGSCLATSNPSPSPSGDELPF